MMRTTILVTALLVLMLSASAVYAQKVESVLVDGHPVINCEGMLPEAYTTTAKGRTEIELSTDTANEKVYKRFAVHKNDNSIESPWPDAFTVCTDVGDGWRLPTQRELMLMWVLKSALEKTSGFISFDTSGYWNATKGNISDNSWSVLFLIGRADNYTNKTSNYRVRCVREL